MDETLLNNRRKILHRKFFSSFFLQIKGLAELPGIQEILEIGPGGGTFKLLMESIGYKVFTADLNKSFEPDYLGDFRELSIDKQFDAVVAFEVLEHLPYEDFKPSIVKMAELSRKYVYISLPCQVATFRFEIGLLNFHLKFANKTLSKAFCLSRYMEKPLHPEIDAEKLLRTREDYWNPHYWEIGRDNYPKKRILECIEACGLTVLFTKHNEEHPYHYFILCQK